MSPKGAFSIQQFCGLAGRYCSLELYRLFTVRNDEKLPLYFSKIEIMLVIVLGGQFVKFGDTNFVTTKSAAINTGVWSIATRCMFLVEFSVITTTNVSVVLTLSHFFSYEGELCMDYASRIAPRSS
jgi:hypothetical protein